MRIALRSAGVDSSLLVVGDGRCRLLPGSNSKLGAFDVETPTGPPPAIVRLDAESGDEEFKEVLLPEVIAAAARREDVMSVNALLERVVSYWSVYGRSAKGRVRQRAEAALRSLASGELRDDFRLEPGGQSVEGSIIRILRTPATFDPRGETQGWQRLRRRGERVLRGRARPQLPGQVSFEELARETEVGEE